jgi:hypothetical protein
VTKRTRGELTARGAASAPGWALALATVTLAAALTGGCGDGGSGVGGRPTSGALGNASVRPECGAFNQTCLARGLDAPLVLGSLTELTLESQVAGSSGPPLQLHGSNPAVLKIVGSKVKAVGVGIAGLLFKGPKDQVIDFIHVWVARPMELRILRYTSSGLQLGQVQDAVTLLVGDELLISVEPYAGGQALVGTFELHRLVTGDAVSVVPDPVGGWYRVVARQAGKAKIELKALGLTRSWSIEVKP